MKLFLFYLRYSPHLILLAACIGAVSGCSMAVLIGLINDSLSGAHLTAATSIWAFSGLVLTVLISSYLSRVLMLYLTKRVIFDLRMYLCRQVIVTPLRKLEEIGGHRILAALTEDIGNLARAFLNVPVICINIATIAGCVVYLWRISASILVFSSVYLVLAVLSNYLIGQRAKRVLRRAREDWDALVGHFRALTDGIKQLKLHRPRSEAFLSGPLHSSAASFRQGSFKGDHIYAVAQSWQQAQYFVFMGIILFKLASSGLIVSTSFVSLTLVILYLKTPISILVDLLPVFTQGRISLEKIGQLGLSFDEFGKRKARKQPPHPKLQQTTVSYLPKKVEMIAVTHYYYREREEREFVFGPIDLTLRTGEMVFLVGGNGSGKTTLAKLLTGLYKPESGTVMLDNYLITDKNRSWYNQLFTVIFSDFHLFDSLLGLEKSTPNLDAAARELLVELQLDHKIEIRNGVLSTTNLSQGQRKRLALLTAFLEDRPFYIFDEWAADQDPLFKEVFYLRLLPNLKSRGKGILVISHDDRYFHVADRIIRLEYGKPVQDQPLAHINFSTYGDFRKNRQQESITEDMEHTGKA